MEARLKHLGAHLHACGQRAVAEFCMAMTKRYGPGVVAALERYARLDPAALAATGLHKLPPNLVLVPEWVLHPDSTEGIRRGRSSRNGIIKRSLAHRSDGGGAA